jgi:hypothetical protein
MTASSYWPEGRTEIRRILAEARGADGGDTAAALDAAIDDIIDLLFIAGRVAVARQHDERARSVFDDIAFSGGQ